MNVNTCYEILLTCDTPNIYHSEIATTINNTNINIYKYEFMLIHRHDILSKIMLFIDDKSNIDSILENYRPGILLKYHPIVMN